MEKPGSLQRRDLLPARLVLVLTAVAAGMLAIALGAVFYLTRPGALVESRALGTDLQGREAPDFRLTDQQGQTFSLSSVRGRPVVLTFLYTSCPDVCPLTASKLRETLDLLGDQADRVVMVAVSVDPARDDRATAAAFSARHGLTGSNWHYLVGSEEDLRPVWSSYGIGQTTAGLGPDSPEVLHTDALFVIDAAGRERRLVRSDFVPAQLAAELRALVKD
jgi:protein SCO1/2